MTLSSSTVSGNSKADFDKDGDADGDDLLIWQAGFNQFTGNAASNDGDANGDGFVDGDDFLLWQAEFTGELERDGGPDLAILAGQRKYRATPDRARAGLATGKYGQAAAIDPTIADLALKHVPFRSRSR